MNGQKATSSSTAEARQLYHQATRAFLVRDYATAASCLHDGISRLDHVEQDAWFKALETSGSTRERVPPAHVIELRRRLDILKVTLLATVRSSPAALSPAPSLTPLLELEPDKLIHALWSDLIGSSAPDVEVVPTPAASHLHPSLAVSLALAALKLDSPKSARAVVEAWFGSVGEDVEVVVADFASNGTVDWQAGIDFPLDQVAGGGGAQGSRANQDLSDSSTTLGQAPRSDQEAAVRALVESWLKLLDLLVFHILPKLDEWDAAGDFVRLQGQENGGWIPDVRVEVRWRAVFRANRFSDSPELTLMDCPCAFAQASLQRLKELQREQIELAAARVQRQKELELARAEKKKQTSTSASSRRSTDKGKERARDERNGSPPGGSSPSRKHARGNNQSSSSSSSPSPSEEASSRSPPRAHASPPPATGFASMRDSLSTYLQKPERDSPASSSSSVPMARSTRTTTRSASSPISALVSYVRYHYATDPVRLVSFVCFVLALLTWTRRRLSLRRSRGQRGLGLGDAFRVAGAKLAETVGMATKVTAM